MPYIKKIINNVEITFNDEATKSCFEPIITDINDAFSKIDVSYEKMWLDVGCSVYDLHIEIDAEDLYFDIEGDNLVGVTHSKGIDLKKNFGEEIVSKMIEAIRLYKTF